MRIVTKDRHDRSNAWPWLYRAAKPGVRSVVPLLALVFVFLLAVPTAEDSPAVATKARRAQELVDELRAALSIDHDVQVSVIVYHPLVFSAEPMNSRRERFLLSLELGFLLMLEEDELRAALAHELGHVWIFTHHPFLHTEQLANRIGQRAVNRESLERVYSKLWSYEGTPGVPIEQLLGPL